MSHGPLAVYDQCDGKINAELDDWVQGGGGRLAYGKGCHLMLIHKCVV